MRRSLAALALTATIALTGCGGGEPEAAADPLEEAGCESPTEADTEELYVQTMYRCGSGPARVLLFADNEARDAFVETAEHFGGTYVKGEKWAAEER